jgi:ubiquinone/menaquinone biosynthesis C-methylase UbiE
MTERFVPWVDPFTNDVLHTENNFLVSSSSKYPIIDGIPNFISEITDAQQNQVKESFGQKWTSSNFGQSDEEFHEKIKPVFLEMMGLQENNLSIFNDKIILEIGIGSGSSARLWAPQAKEFHGMDISKAIYKVKNVLKFSNPILAQADLNHLPYPDSSFDVIVSNGVLHHTPNTMLALQNSLKKLKKGGLYIFYIYKKKSPLREFSDDYIRAKISNLDYEQAWQKIKPLTEFGKAIHEQNIEINIPADVEILGIKKGKYNLQRFIYDNIFKCFWNESWGYDHSNLVNVDWYHPKYCWRHTEDEIRSWCSEFNLKINYIKELQSGFACSVIKNQ